MNTDLAQESDNMPVGVPSTSIYVTETVQVTPLRTTLASSR